MPNWITNILEFNQKEIHSEFKEFLKGSRNMNEAIDFNKFIFQPIEIDIMNDDLNNRLAICAYISYLMDKDNTSNPFKVIVKRMSKKASESPTLRYFMRNYISSKFKDKMSPNMYKDYFLELIMSETKLMDSKKIVLTKHGITDEFVLNFLKKQEGFKDEEIGEIKPVTKENLLDLGKFYFNSLMKYGCFDWFNWRVENWGTKWNACHSKWVNDYTLIFDTAWAPPIPIIREIKKKFSYMQMTHYYVDEGNILRPEIWYTDKYNKEFICKTPYKDPKQLTTYIYSMRDGIQYSVKDLFDGYEDEDEE